MKQNNANNKKSRNSAAEKTIIVPRPVFSPQSHEEITLTTGWMLPTRNGFGAFVKDTFVYTNASPESLFESQRFVKDFMQPASPYRGLLLYFGVGRGKCHARGTPILMADGRTKAAEDVREGDLLMGDDSTPRTVLSNTRGRAAMYRVTTTFRGTAPPLRSSYVVNADHVLCLKASPSSASETTEITVADFLALPAEDARRAYLGYRAPVEFPLIEPHVDPYHFGQLLAQFARLRDGSSMPDVYMRNHSSVRLALLAGVIDAASDVQPCPDRYVITLELRESLAADVVRLCLSLGLAAHATPRTGTMRIVIYGAGIGRIPCRSCARKESLDDAMHGEVSIDALLTADDYFGFAVDGNHRYLLGDFVVTHNSCAAIVAAENFMRTKKIVVMLPASLRGNFMDEIKNRCGNVYFSPKRRWTFYSFEYVTGKIGLKQESAIAFYLSDITGIHKSIVAAHKGVWIAADVGSTNNTNNTNANNNTAYEDLPDAAKNQIRKQLDDIIQRKYEFINYNGLSGERKLSAYTDPKKNPFDHCVVVIDEVHRFISMYLNEGKTGVPLYQRLREARDARLILLSGTPIVNDAYEAACIINLLSGPQLEYELTLAGGISKDAQKAAAYLRDHPHVDIYDMQRVPGHAFIRLCPEGFRFTDKSRYAVARDPNKTTAKQIMDEIAVRVNAVREVKENTKRNAGSRGEMVLYTAKEYDIFPATPEAFREIYVDPSTSQLRYEGQIQRRMMGRISYFSSEEKNYPSVREEYTRLTMTPAMFTVYTEQRGIEIARESKNRLRRKKEGDAADLPETYRIYSRMCCNFVYPESIKRVYKGSGKGKGKGKGKLTRARNNNAAVKRGGSNVNNSKQQNNSKANNSKQQNNSIPVDAEAEAEAEAEPEDEDEDAAAKLERQKMTLLSPAALAQLSPKAAKIIERVRKQMGKVVIYSDFKITEGVGHIAMALDVQGYKEAIVTYHAATRTYDTNITKDDVAKPKYFRFRNRKDNPGVQVLMDLFNNEIGSVPDNIKAAFGIPSTAGANNLHGEFLKVILITRAAAEGISLKQVREVHVTEVFWNEARIQQVIGRAVRAGSHTDLPDAEQNVTVYRYIVEFSEDQTKNMPSLLKNDIARSANSNSKKTPRYMTTDVYMQEHAAAKYVAVTSMQNLMKGAATDCSLMRKYHPDVTCMTSPPGEGREPTYKMDHRQDAFETAKVAVRQTQVLFDYFRECKIDNETYALDPRKMVLYDLDLYLSGKLVRVGTLTKHGKDGGVWRAKFDA